MNSSPELPGLCDILEERKSRVASGSRAANIPLDAIKGFSKASDIHRVQSPAPTSLDSSIFEYIPGNGEWKAFTDEGVKEPKPKVDEAKVWKRVGTGKRPARGSRGRAVGQPRKRDETGSLAGESKSTAEDSNVSPQRKRPKKVGFDGQLTIGKGRVKKAHTTTNDMVNDYVKQQTTLSKPLTPPKQISIPYVSAMDNEPALGLEKASTRRRDWTPVKGNGNLKLPDISETQSLEPEQSEASTVFKCLASNFSFVKPTGTEPTDNGCFVSEGLTTHRRLELIQNVQARQEHSPKSSSKKLAAKKKPLTITEKVTRQFIEPPPSQTSNSSSLLSYFPNQPIENSDKQKRSNGRRNKDTKKEAKMKPMPIVLSPGEALVALNDQDLVFGTSSQLIREDSPMLIRDLQLALKSSESDFDRSEHMERKYMPQNVMHKRQADSSIWSAAARDSQGSLLDAEVINLTTPNVLNFNPTSSLRTSPVSRVAQLEEPEVLEPCTSKFSRRDEATHLEIQPQTNSKPAESLDATLNFPLEPFAEHPSMNIPAMPNFAQQKVEVLRKQLAYYGFKPTRSKKNMVAILSKCWLSKHRGLQESSEQALFSKFDESSQPLPISVSAPPKRRGRPPKTEVTPAGVIRDAAVVSAPRKSRLEKAASRIQQDLKPPPSSQISPHLGDSDNMGNHTGQLELRAPVEKPLTQPFELVESKYVQHAAASAENEHEYIFHKIAQAIKTYPSSNDPNELSWNEKILLYDPIVLEDLTVWLNTTGLRAINVDEEIWPTLVRDWCESRSICCLWKTSLRGGERVRH